MINDNEQDRYWATLGRLTSLEGHPIETDGETFRDAVSKHAIPVDERGSIPCKVYGSRHPVRMPVGLLERKANTSSAEPLPKLEEPLHQRKGPMSSVSPEIEKVSGDTPAAPPRMFNKYVSSDNLEFPLVTPSAPQQTTPTIDNKDRRVKTPPKEREWIIEQVLVWGRSYGYVAKKAASGISKSQVRNIVNKERKRQADLDEAQAKARRQKKAITDI